MMQMKPVHFSIQPLIFFGVFLAVNIILFGGVHMVDSGNILTFLGLGGLLFGKIVGIAGALLLATAVGMSVLRVIRVQFVPVSLQWMAAFGLGLAVLGYSMFFLAIAQQANSFFVILLLLFLVYWARSDVQFLYGLLKKNVPIVFFLKDIWLWILGVFAITVGELGFIASMATLINARYDSFHQYLTFPMTYFSHGGFTSFLWHPSWGFPQFGEMLFLLSITLVGVSGPFLLNYALTIIFAWMILQTLKNWGIGAIRYPLAICIVFSPIVIALGFGYLKIEMIYYLCCLLLLVLVKEVYIHEGKIVSGFSRSHIVVGIFIGVLFSLKYTAIFITGAIFVALFLLTQEKKAFLRGSFFTGVIAMLVLLPWLMKNWIVYKSPFYPIFQGEDQWFQATGKMCSENFGKYASDDLILQHASFLVQKGWLILDNLQLLLFSMTHVALDGALMMLPGVWLLFFLPLVFLRAWQWRTLDVYSKFLLVFSGIFFIEWAQFLIGGTWYLVPAFLGIFLFVSRGLLIKSSIAFFTKGIVVIVVFFSVVLIIPKLFQDEVMNSIRYANGHVPLKEAARVAKSEIGPIDMYGHINELLRFDDNAKIYGFMEPRGYFIDDSAKRFVLDYYGEKIRCLGSLDEVKQSLRGMGVQYIVANTGGKKRCGKMIDPQVNELCRSIDFFDSFIQSESPQVLYEEGDTALYRLR